MKVQFEFTVRDLAEVAAKQASASSVVQTARSTTHLMWAASIGLCAFAVVPAALVGRLMSGLGAFAISTLLWKKAGVRSPALIKYYREQLGGDGPFTCEVELGEAGLRTRQFESEAIHPWNHVISIESIAEGIEFRMKPFGWLLVRDRAFPNSEAKQQFLQYARHLQSREL